MKKSQIIYLDSCIFIASFLKEKEKINKIKKFFEDSKSLNIKFVTSDWTLTEIVTVLIKNKKIPSKKVANYIQEIERTKRVENIKFEFIKIKEENYDLEEFFFGIQKIQLEYRGSLGDAIHALIMKKNLIKTILTTDSEFAGMKDMNVINPLIL